MSWTNDDVIQLVELIRRRPSLYDKDHESFYNETKKLEILQELATIISSTRPETSVEDILSKWEEIRSKFFTTAVKVKKSKKRPSSDIFFYEKMKFMLNFYNPEEQSVDQTEEPVKEEKTVKKAKGRGSRNVKVSVARYKAETAQHKEEINSINMDQESREISLLSENSDNCENAQILESPVYRKKKRFSQRVLAGNSTANDISNCSMMSPQVTVSDSILDRTVPLVNESDSFSHMRSLSPNSGDSFVNDDEDTLYIKYLLCKFRKLDDSSKVRFKVEIERLFYQTLSAG